MKSIDLTQYQVHGIRGIQWPSLNFELLDQLFGTESIEKRKLLMNICQEVLEVLEYC
jgi:hypothetical protein